MLPDLMKIGVGLDFSQSYDLRLMIDCEHENCHKKYNKSMRAKLGGLYIHKARVLVGSLVYFFLKNMDQWFAYQDG